jgi:hypothetical protein
MIVAETSPMTAKMKSKPFRGESRPDWDRVRINVMRWALRVKLACNWSKFSDLLFSTGGVPIVEDSRNDAFWGAVQDGPDLLVGVNALGRLLMELREELRRGDTMSLSYVAPLRIQNFLLFERPIGAIEARPSNVVYGTILPSEKLRAASVGDPLLLRNLTSTFTSDMAQLGYAGASHRGQATTSHTREPIMHRDERFSAATREFTESVRAKLTSVAAIGQPEDQLRAPLESLIGDVAELCGVRRDTLAVIGESTLSDLKTRPDYAIVVNQVLIGFIEIKAPGKGADPRKFKGHDKTQWEKLRALPNLIYTDGTAFSLWRGGELQGSVVRLAGETATSELPPPAPAAFSTLFEDFFGWEPIPPRTARQLAETSARLCRLLRDEVTEQLALRNPALTDLAVGWRKLLFPEATDSEFADGYAQAVTFGLLMARARDIDLHTGLDRVARELGQTNSLIGAALRLLTDDAENKATLKTSLDTLVRVLSVVDWRKISKGNTDAWLYFYEDFLAVYDNALRKKTGSYYTPPEIVDSMVRLVDEVLRSPIRFNCHTGLASSAVTLADPALGTGTFLLGALRRIAKTTTVDEGPGAVRSALRAAAARLIGFEIQLGPYAVAQLRLLAELAEMNDGAAITTPRVFVADTLANPYMEEEWLDTMVKPIAESRRSANRIKIEEPITVVLGNPPYKEKAKGRGGWVESGSPTEAAPLLDWIPPRSWRVSAHTKHLRNLYVYFWRWATWKVFDRERKAGSGIVCYITAAGFLSGAGFERMRDYLRRTTDEIWVIDCSPEGHQPEVNTRVFEDVQQPVCIVLASRSPTTDANEPARVRYYALPTGHRSIKFDALSKLEIESDGWADCDSDWRAPFLPSGAGAWATYPALSDIFEYNGSGVMPGRTWIIAPDRESLQQRWNALMNAAPDEMEALFQPHLRGGKPGDKHVNKIVAKGLPGYPARPVPVADERGPLVAPIRYAFRSFDRQWIIPDPRLINQPNPELWRMFSEAQIYLTAPSDKSPTAGPAITFTSLIPDLHHYNGRGGRVFPLWRDRDATHPNVSDSLLSYLMHAFGKLVSADEVLAYVACVAASPAYTLRFKNDLIQPGLRIPFTADATLFAEAVELGRTIVWLHTFGQRFVDPLHGRPAGPPRLSDDQKPLIPSEGAIPDVPETMPESMEYDAEKRVLRIGRGFVEGVDPRVWNYQVSGVPVLRHWFSYRKADRERPIIGDRRPPSRLGAIQSDHWRAEYTTELLNLLNVLGRLVELEPTQAELLDRICTSPTFESDTLKRQGAIGMSSKIFREGSASESPGQMSLLE